ncbi:MAG: hypothetical protein J1F23_06015 [Oscillospiraceae bacterium]|nr:hypothetical protein [Oscillospiraceae bacterium]
MADEFDTSVDTSSFDDTGSDVSDTSSFDTSTDVGEIMSDNSFDVADTFAESELSDMETIETTSDIGDLMADTDAEYTESLDTTEIETDIIEDGSDNIENLMDDAPNDGFSEVSDIPSDITSETEFAAESDIVDLMDEAALETAEESLDITDGEPSESLDISELMDETVNDSPDETIENLEAVDTTENIADETMDDIESLMDNNNSEVSDTPEETEEIAAEVVESGTDLSDLMNETDEPSEMPSDISVETTEEVSDALEGNEEITTEVTEDGTDLSAPMNETVGQPELSSDIPAEPLEQVSETADMSEGNFDETVEDTTDGTIIDASNSETDVSAYDNLMAYMNSHNYGQQDVGEYSQDPEWQELNNAYRIEQGMEPIDYGGNDWTDTHVEDFKDELVALGIPEESAELEAIIENEQQGIDDIKKPTPVDEPNNEDLLDGAEEIIDADSADISNEIEAIAEAETIEPVEDLTETPRVFDDFENSVLEGKPDFYETGSFYEQGINEYGYQGTCGPTSQANALNKLFDTNEFTENKVLNVAVDNNLCSMDTSPENCGGTTTEQFMELYDKMNEQLDGKIDTQLFEYDNALDVNDVADKLDEGCVLNVAVDANALWDQPREYVNSMGIPCDDFYSDHWITVTGVQRDELGNVQGFDIIDSGGGVDYVSADKYHEMCFGTDEHRVIDPTAIVVSKKDVSPVGEIPTAEGTSSDINDSTSNNSESGWFQRIFGRRNN